MMFNKKCSLLLMALLLVFTCRLSAQEVIVFDDLEEFGKIPKTWKMVGEVSSDWEHTDFLATKPGTGILVSPPKPKNGPHLISGFEHGDMELELEFMVPKGSNSGIYLQGRYEIQIFDSWGKINPNSGDAGGIYQRFDKETRRGFEGKPPRLNVSKAPGLWQHYKIVFEAPRFNAQGEKVKNAKFVQVFQNGVLIHENVEVTGPTTSALFEDEKPLGPIMIQGDHGPVAIRNIKFKPYGNEVPKITDLTYAYHKGKFQAIEDFLGKTPTQTGQINKVTWDLGHGVLDFAYEYSGNFEIVEPGDYTFSLAAFGTTSLYINGKNVLEDQNTSPRSSTIRLEKGLVPFKLVFYKNNWPGRRPQLGFFVEGPGIKKSPLQDPNSYVEHVIQKPLYVEPTNEPMIIRGFFQHGQEKKTHTVGVGEPTGTSFAYDLQQGTVLGIWRGGFLDASPMWRQRGESQLMIPNGALVEFASGPTIAKLDDKNSPWPDSLGSNQLHIQGYSLNRARRPTFKYIVDQISVEDYLEPEMDGKILTRTIGYANLQKTSDLWSRIIAAEHIEEIGEGVYYINKGQFYVQLAESILSDAVLRNTAQGKELIVPISTSEEKKEIKYSLIW